MYDQFASDYDRFVNWQNRLDLEIPLIDSLIIKAVVDKTNRAEIRVLDAACGTGMHALALAGAGYQVCGADNSPAMVSRALKNAKKANASLCFETAGFGSFKKIFGEAQFDVVLCLGNSLPHLLVSAELHAAIKDFSACLRPGGLLLIQNRNFDAVLNKKDRWQEPQEYQQGDRQWVFQRFYDFNPDGTIQFNMVTLKRRTTQHWRPTVFSTRLWPMRHDEISRDLVNAGFEKFTPWVA